LKNRGARLNQPLSLWKGTFSLYYWAGPWVTERRETTTTIGQGRRSCACDQEKGDQYKPDYVLHVFAPLENVEFAREKAALRRLIVK
jgi:hypothetical protein